MSSRKAPSSSGHECAAGDAGCTRTLHFVVVSFCRLGGGLPLVMDQPLHQLASHPFIEEGFSLGPLLWANGKSNECLLAATKPLAIYMSAEGCLLGAYYWTFP